MQNIKYINAYRLQYWLYAILNKKFGKMVSFERDGLHSRYSVNRHGFYVHGISHHIVLTELTLVLNEAGYTQDKSFGSSITLTKCVQKGDKLERHYIMMEARKFVNKKQEFLSILPSVYYF